MGFFRACLEVMGVEESLEENVMTVGIAHISSYLEDLPRARYLAESTIGTGGDLQKEADGHLRLGRQTSGSKITIDAPVNWASYATKSRTIRYKVQSMLICDSILRADSSQRDLKWYSPCLAYVKDWVSTFIVRGEFDDFLWYDMAVGQRATKLSYIIRRALEENEDYRHIAPMIVAAEIHIRELMKEEKIAEHSNHGLFQMAGLLSLGKLLPFLARSEDAITFARNKILMMLKEHFTEGGLHKEHSPIYHIIMTNYMHSLIDSEFFVDDFLFEDISRKAVTAASWLITPDHNVLQFGDSPPVDVLRRANFPVNLENGRPGPPSGLKVFHDGGLVISSKHDIEGNPSEYLAIMGSFFSRQHKHCDDMGFQFYHDGKAIMCDAGTFTYQYNQKERIFIESTRAHNCLEIDGYDYSRFNADVFGSCIDYAVDVGGCLFVEGSVQRTRLVPTHLPYNKVKNEDCEKCNIKQKRIIFYLPERFLIIIDEVVSKKDRKYTQWFNLSPKVRADLRSGNIIISDSQEVRCVARKMNPDVVKGFIVSEQTSPRLQGWTSVNGFTLDGINSIGMATSGKRAIIGTMLDLKFDQTRVATINTSRDRKYLRAVIEERGGKIEMIVREKADEMLLEFIHHGRSFTESVN